MGIFFFQFLIDRRAQDLLSAQYHVIQEILNIARIVAVLKQEHSW